MVHKLLRFYKRKNYDRILSELIEVIDRKRPKKGPGSNWCGFYVN